MTWGSTSWGMHGQKNMRVQEKGLLSQPLFCYVLLVRPFAGDQGQTGHDSSWTPGWSCLSVTGNQHPWCTEAIGDTGHFIPDSPQVCHTGDGDSFPSKLEESTLPWGYLYQHLSVHFLLWGWCLMSRFSQSVMDCLGCVISLTVKLLMVAPGLVWETCIKTRHIRHVCNMVPHLCPQL